MAKNICVLKCVCARWAGGSGLLRRLFTLRGSHAQQESKNCEVCTRMCVSVSVCACIQIYIYMTHGHFFFFCFFFSFFFYIFTKKKANMTFFFQATRPQNSKLTNSFLNLYFKYEGSIQNTYNKIPMLSNNFTRNTLTRQAGSTFQNLALNSTDLVFFSL